MAIQQDLNQIQKGRSRKFYQRGSNFDNFVFVCWFLVDEEREGPNTTINGSMMARQGNSIRKFVSLAYQ